MMSRFVIAILFALALIIPILSNAWTSEEKTGATGRAVPTDNRANCLKNAAPAR